MGWCCSYYGIYASGGGCTVRSNSRSPVVTELPAPEAGRGAGVVVTTAVQTGASWLRCAASDAETR